MISNYSDEVLRHGVGYYTAEVIRPFPTKDRVLLGGVIFRFDAFRSEVRVIPAGGRDSTPVKIPIANLHNVKFIHNELKSLAKPE